MEKEVGVAAKVFKFIHKHLFLLVVLFLIIFIPKSVFAHALLEKATPVPDSYLESSPKEVILSFNERLEKELFSITVFNGQGKVVSVKKTKMSKNQKQISQNLPVLPDGNYTISYHVISSDGHPVKGSYVIIIGKYDGINSENLFFENGGTDSNNQLTFTIIRIFYYISLILLSGWILWASFHHHKGSYKKWSLYLQTSYLIFNLAIGFILFSELIDGWDTKEILSILSGTTAGISWTISILLSMIGFLFLLKNKWFDCIWVLGLLITKAVNGHPLASNYPMVTVSLDIVHLLASAMWAGGLFFILLNWKNQSDEVRNFLFRFSKAALVSIFVLIVTGIVFTLIFLPKWSYVLYTDWGKWLLTKSVLVLLVVLVGVILRSFLKKKVTNVGTWIKVDFSLMILILCIVGVFTHLNPIPQNSPLEWNDRQKSIEMTALITPMRPGENHFMVSASSIQNGLNIKNIELFLINQDNENLAPIKVPFQEIEPSNEVSYMIDGQYLPFAGKWKAEIRILDSEDNEEVFSKEFMVY